jgi:hypothetical protein
VVGSSTPGFLIPLTIGNQVLETPTTGFTYFHITIHYDAWKRICLYGTGVQHHSVVNYGHLLPYLSVLETGNITNFTIKDGYGVLLLHTVAGTKQSNDHK